MSREDDGTYTFAAEGANYRWTTASAYLFRHRAANDPDELPQGKLLLGNVPNFQPFAFIAFINVNTRPYLRATKEFLIMQAVCPRKDLYEAVQTAGRAVSGRSTLPILSHILAQPQGDGTLKLTATDLEMWMECRLPARLASRNGR